MEPALVACHVVAFLFWLIRLIRIVIYFFKLLEIRSFYKHALRITEVCIIITSWLMYDCPLPKQVGSWLGISNAKVVGIIWKGWNAEQKCRITTLLAICA